MLGQKKYLEVDSGKVVKEALKPGSIPIKKKC